MDRKLSADDVAKPTPAVGLDVDFAKSLRDFFREAREIQNGMHEMREYGLYKDFFLYLCTMFSCFKLCICQSSKTLCVFYVAECSKIYSFRKETD